MSLVKRRPRIQLKGPPELRPGHDALFRVYLDAREPVDIDGVRLTLRGIETASIGSGKSKSSRRVEVVSLAAELSGATQLAAGRHAYDARIRLPPDAPPSYRGLEASTVYEARVHVDIPWWPDARRRFEMCVSLDPARSPRVDAPVIVSTNPGGPRRHEPHVEVSLASHVVTPGGAIDGSFALSNVRHHRYRGARVTLRGRETRTIEGLIGARTHTNAAWKHAWYVPTPNPVEGAPVPFRIAIPRDLGPTFASRLWKLDWDLEVLADLAWERDCGLTIPIVVRPEDPTSPAPATIRFAPPSVGSPRVARMWQEVAEELGLRHERGAIVGRRGQVDVQVTREHRGRAGTVLRGRIAYPPLHLGIAIRPVGLGDLLFGAEPVLGGYVAAGRDRAQVRRFATALVAAIEPLRVVALDDDDAIAEVRDAGHARDSLRAFVRGLVTLADAIEAARAVIPPPTPLAARIDGWSALAERLRGELEIARVRVTGTFRDADATVEMLWSTEGEPNATRMALRSPALAHVPEFGDDDTVPDLVKPLLDLVVRAELKDGELAAWVPPWLDDPLPLLDLLGRVHDVAARLAVAAAPYR